MRPITITRQPERLCLDGRVVCVYHKQYRDQLPQMPDGHAIAFDALCDSYQTTDHFAAAESVAFVGANKFFNPSTRFHGVFELLQYGLPQIPCYSIDTAPYVGPIWRLWTHWSLSRQPWDGYTYSYLLESHYNAHREGARPEDPMSDARILANAAGCVSIDYQRYFSDPVEHVCHQPSDIHARYQRLKSDLFESHDTIGPIIKGLSGFASDVYPARSIPQAHRIFLDPDRVHIVRTDLPIDRYLADQIKAKINEVNHVCGLLNAASEAPA